MNATQYVLKSGRRLGVVEYGAPDSDRVVVFCHPAPGSALFDPDPVATADAGVRVIAIDRPGYGESALLGAADPDGEGAPASVEQAAADIAEYLAFAEVASVGAIGWSAGGRVALALAANYPGLVSRAVAIATPAPDEQVPWVGEDNRAMLEPLRELPVAEAVTSLAGTFERYVGLAPAPEVLMGFVGVTEVDESVLEIAGVRERLLAMLERSTEQGTTGMAADIVGYSILDWGFDPALITAPVLLLAGAGDELVGEEHSAWYASVVPGSVVEVVPDAGHLVVVPAWRIALDFLAEADPADAEAPTL